MNEHPAHSGPQVAFVSIGSNMGRRRDNCRRAVEAMAAVDGVRIVAQSPLYLTEPVDFVDQQWFVNAAVKIETDLDPHRLLERLQQIQAAFGRKAGGVRFGPRVLDLDIVLFGDRVIRTATLTVPHPRMHKRRFVLQPICDIDPGVVHPVLGRTVAELLAGVDQGGQELVPV